ncbi:MAG: RNA polymerase sigma factor [Bacteroidales bacterium]|nr:RNA polymerase sigma factor [Bacteroidales bacterium]
MTDRREDSEIVADILNGDKDSFRILAERYSDTLFRVAMGYLHSKEDSEDIVQDVFIKVYNSLDSFKGDSKLSTWLYRIMVNACLNEIDRKRRRGIFERIEEGMAKISNKGAADRDPQESMIADEVAVSIRKAIDSLPDKQKTAFILQKYQDLSQKEISTIMQITEGSVEQLLIRGKNNLKNKLRHINSQ